MIPICWLSEAREFSALRPIEIATVDDYTTHGGAVATNPLRSAVSNDVGTKLDRRTDIAAHAKSIVNDQGDAMVISHLRNSRDVRNIVLRVGDGLDVDSSCVLVDQLGDGVRLVSFDKLDSDIELLHVNAELIIGAAVQPADADEVVSGTAAIRDCHELLTTQP